MIKMTGDVPNDDKILSAAIEDGEKLVTEIIDRFLKKHAGKVPPAVGEVLKKKRYYVENDANGKRDLVWFSELAEAKFQRDKRTNTITYSIGWNENEIADKIQKGIDDLNKEVRDYIKERIHTRCPAVAENYADIGLKELCEYENKNALSFQPEWNDRIDLERDFMEDLRARATEFVNRIENSIREDVDKVCAKLGDIHPIYKEMAITTALKKVKYDGHGIDGHGTDLARDALASNMQRFGVSRKGGQHYEIVYDRAKHFLDYYEMGYNSDIQGVKFETPEEKETLTEMLADALMEDGADIRGSGRGEAYQIGVDSWRLKDYGKHLLEAAKKAGIPQKEVAISLADRERAVQICFEEIKGFGVLTANEQKTAIDAIAKEWAKDRDARDRDPLDFLGEKYRQLFGNLEYVDSGYENSVSFRGITLTGEKTVRECMFGNSSFGKNRVTSSILCSDTVKTLALANEKGQALSTIAALQTAIEEFEKRKGAPNPNRDVGERPIGGQQNGRG
ncbi:MAG: hypothetical protein LBL34_02010 [Clostridiales bacterium]|jgi:hypothetical protein|nr:hypothetical protein [Clostridiales bacterium]